jgi:hypothetical protein
MKLLGGRWSVVDFCILVTALAAILTIPGMPRVFHWDSRVKSEKVDPSKAIAPDPKPDPSGGSSTVESRETKSQPPGKKDQSGSTVGGSADIDSVGPVSAKAWQTILIKGTHFGSAQPYNGCSDFLPLTDLTDNRVFGKKYSARESWRVR